jgi:hypothetical protein
MIRGRLSFDFPQGLKPGLLGCSVGAEAPTPNQAWMKLVLRQGWGGFLGFYFHYYSREENHAGDQDGCTENKQGVRRA